MELGNVIKDKRNELQLTQEQLATKLHVSRQTISKWENNETYPNLDILISISEILNLSTDELLKGENNNVVEKISLDVKGKKKYKKMVTLFYTAIAITMIFLGIFSIGHHYQVEKIDYFNPFLKTQTSYAILPVTNKPLPKKDIYIQTDAYGNGFWQYVQAGIIDKDEHWAMVQHKGSYVYSLKLIEKKYWGYPRGKYETLDYLPYDKKGPEPRTSSWNPFH
ncbi:helix-turn-helix transcriptional regulator [Companilactobacillus nodensis]|uniref:Transcriptional regulator, xre family n=1 Tax=Companilactobacillus nodensis DSM 19682 = JCM 14932 = NBRC 107160 TaxID=1423775 RepID=A0A0R1KNP7_9LACO|nr:helix-turn-helix transcriptional regulator [Companilactobacillus nodensis]KRK80935.1 transcriptional regulator, xre family [Companilactobacillus nodensis DSM 19682 = JCM 14932 = NBRC 107160]